MPELFVLSQRARARLAGLERTLGLARSHAARGERRAASARLAHLEGERAAFARELEFPAEYAALGFQVGLVAAPGPLVRGRAAGALVAGALGWCVGHAIGRARRRRLDAIAREARAIARALG